MIPEEHALRHFFHEVVSECYYAHLGVEDAELSSYVGDLLTDFCAAEKLYRIRDAHGRPVKEVGEMLVASDPIHGSAPSFDAERELRKHIGDYALFCTGMYPESMNLWGQRERASMLEMVRAGKESYYIVSQFNVFEYAIEAPLFAKLAESFERCVYGLTKVRSELQRRRPESFSMPDGPHLLM
jgi:hypothetical protein